MQPHVCWVNGPQTVGDVEHQVVNWIQENIDPELQPHASRLSFLWDGKEHAPSNMLYKLGIGNSTKIVMRIAPAPSGIAEGVEEHDDAAAAAEEGDHGVGSAADLARAMHEAADDGVHE